MLLPKREMGRRDRGIPPQGTAGVKVHKALRNGSFQHPPQLFQQCRQLCPDNMPVTGKTNGTHHYT